MLCVGDTRLSDLVQPYMRYGLYVSGNAVVCSLCARLLKAPRVARVRYLVDHVLSNMHCKKVDRAIRGNRLSFLPPPGHTQRVQIYGTHKKMIQENK